MLRDHGQSQKYYHHVVGVNSRMDGIQGAVLSVKLKYLESWNEKRRALATLYTELLQDVEGLVLPREMEYARHVYHIFAIRVKGRDDLMKELAAKGIGCGIHYPVPVHLQEAYKSLNLGRGSFPVAERHGEEFVSLPLFPEMTPAQQEYVVEQIRNYFGADHRKIA
jgi:dTDP-4-amino-4,6-dideoxygalactose transaminase